MTDSTRAHERIPKSEVPGRRWTLSLGTLFLPDRAKIRSLIPLVVHFHGAPSVVEWSVYQKDRQAAVIAINIGAGSKVYANAFADPGRFRELLEEAGRQLSSPRPVEFRPIALSSFSAGYGATREILKNPANWDLIDAIVLADGLHTSYIPEGTPGPIETDNLAPFVAFAREAKAARKQMIVTHSEIFPGTFASTTETADYLLQQLGIKRHAVMKWGAGGMQQLSEAHAGRFHLLGFAGNTAPDHIDHLHGLNHWLKLWRGQH